MIYMKNCLMLTAVLAFAIPPTQAEVVLSSAGDITVTQEDIERYIGENVPDDKSAAILQRAGIYREMAESIYIVRTLAAEAETLPDFDPAQAAWAAKMKYQRRLVEEFRVNYVRYILRNADWEASAREVYLVEGDRFMSPEIIRASHILVSTEERSDEEALQLAQDLHARAVAGEDFAELAIEYTDDPAGKKNGGDLGFIGRGKMVPTFEEAAFALRSEGELSEPVKSPFGYHVIRLLERKEQMKKPFDEVKDKIINEIQTQRGNQVWQDKIIATRSSPDIKINDALLEETKLKTTTPLPQE